MLYRAGLARKTTTLDGADDVVLLFATGDLKRLVDYQTQGWAGEIDGLVTAIDGDLARAGLQPYAGNGVLAATGCIRTTLCIDFAIADRCSWTCTDDRSGNFTSFGRNRSGRCSSGQILEISQAGYSVVGSAPA